MIQIINDGITISIPNDKFASIMDVYDGIIVQCAKGTSFRFDTGAVPADIASLFKLVNSATASKTVNITVDLDKKSVSDIVKIS